MKENWLIIADDLTGAADCAIAFRRCGMDASVRWGKSFPTTKNRTRIFSYNADSRELPAEASKALHEDLLERLWDADNLLFKKIDSTMRGQPAAEIAATVDFLRDKTGHGFGILAPAFPATGRVTRKGCVVVNDQALEETVLWQRDHTYSSGNLCEIISCHTGLTAHLISLDDVRSNPDELARYINELEAAGDGIAVFDAETEDDLLLIAQACMNESPSRFFIGSAGLAHAIAAQYPKPLPQTPIVSMTTGGVLVVVGSLAFASRNAAVELINSRKVTHMPIEPQILLNGGEALDAYALQVADALRAGDDCLVEITTDGNPDMSLSGILAKALARALRAVAPHVSGLAATGGETASALMESFGINGICLVDEIEAGVSLGITTGKFEIPIATKVGAFGDQNSLVRILDRLVAIRREGVIK